jgi:hypothetical protein
MYLFERERYVEMAVTAANGGLRRLVDYQSVYLDLPILHYLPYRAFSSNQTSSVIFQLFARADLPYDESVPSPEDAPKLNLDPIYSLGLRMVFDWRYYYSEETDRPIIVRSDTWYRR